MFVQMWNEYKKNQEDYNNQYVKYEEDEEDEEDEGSNKE